MPTYGLEREAASAKPFLHVSNQFASVHVLLTSSSFHSSIISQKLELGKIWFQSWFLKFYKDTSGSCSDRIFVTRKQQPTPFSAMWRSKLAPLTLPRFPAKGSAGSWTQSHSAPWSQAQKAASPRADEQIQRRQELRAHQCLLVQGTHPSVTMKTTVTGFGASTTTRPLQPPSRLYFSPNCTRNFPRWVSRLIPQPEREPREARTSVCCHHCHVPSPGHF